MVHDVKEKLMQPTGKPGIWKMWLFYDFKASLGAVYDGNNLKINLPGVSIYTVDLKAKRTDAAGKVPGYGKVIEGRIIFDNLKYMTQAGLLNCEPPKKP